MDKRLRATFPKSSRRAYDFRLCGHVYLQMRDVRSAPNSSSKAEFERVREGPVPDSTKCLQTPGLSVGRKRFHPFANGLDEHLRDRAERPILQGGDADRLSNAGQFHGQCFEFGMFARQEK
jgi:hypothetical protein